MDNGSINASLKIIEDYGGKVIWETGSKRGGNYAWNEGSKEDGKVAKVR